MEKTLFFFKNVQIKPINNRSGLYSNIYEHFVEEDESIRLERDMKQAKATVRNVNRTVSYRYLPQILNTP